MVSASNRAGVEKTGKLPEVEEEMLEALRELKEEKELSGLRCGTAVCGHISELEARGLVSVERLERAGEDWELDVELNDAL